MKLERNQEIYKLFSAGFSCTRIAEMYGMSKQNVSRIVKRQKMINDFYILSNKEVLNNVSE